MYILLLAALSSSHQFLRYVLACNAVRQVNTRCAHITMLTLAHGNALVCDATHQIDNRATRLIPGSMNVGSQITLCHRILSLNKLNKKKKKRHHH